VPGILGSRGGSLLSVKETEIVDNAPTIEWGGGTKAVLPNATLMACYFMSMTAHMEALPASSSLLAKACVAR
jgi:hypothetical protein